MKMSNYGKVIVGTALTVGFAGAAYAASLTVSDLRRNSSTNQFTVIDIDSDGSIEMVGSPRRLRFNIGSSGDRAEIGRLSQKNGARTISGRVKVNNFRGNKISIIQTLNVREPNVVRGPSVPIAQLAIRKVSGSSNQYEFYIVQDSGQPTCRGLGRLTVGTEKTIRLTYEDGKAPVFRSGSGSCTTTDGGDDKTGVGNRYFFGKLGAYHTQSGGGVTDLAWSNITDGDSN